MFFTGDYWVLGNTLRSYLALSSQKKVFYRVRAVDQNYRKYW